MKPTIIRLLGALCLAIGLLGSQTTASAIPISGQIDFVGTATTDTGDLSTAHSFTNFADVIVLGNHNGAYSPITNGTSASMNGFTFNPTGGGVSPLWTIVSLGVTYTFNLNTVTSYVYNSTTGGLTIFGLGTALISGGGTNYTPTSGKYSFSTQQNPGGTTNPSPSTRFTFSSTTSVPDGGTAVALLGLGLVAVEASRRLLNARQLNS